MDKPVALSVFHPNSEVDYGSIYKGSGPGFVDFVWGQHEKAARHCHTITNLYVEAAGEKASSEAYVTMTMRVETPEGALIIENLGRYLDQWTTYEGRWVIMRRRYVPEFQEMHRLAQDELPASRTASRRDLSDPSYALTPKLTFK